MDGGDRGADAGGAADGDGGSANGSIVSGGPTPDPSGDHTGSDGRFSGDPTPRSDVPVYHGLAGPPRSIQGRPTGGGAELLHQSRADREARLLRR